MAECEQLLSQDLQVTITLFSLLFKKIHKKMFFFFLNKLVLISFRNRYFCEGRNVGMFSDYKIYSSL